MRLVLATLLVTLGCGKKAQQGLPPAEDWDQASAAGPRVSLDQGKRPRAMGQRGNPHAGVPGAPPIDDGDDDGDGGRGSRDPHAGMNIDMGGGVDVTQLGIPPPDPTRKIDPSRRVKGVIKVDARAQAQVKPNGPVFVVVKRAGADGQPVGTPLAVEKLTWTGGPLPFELTEANAMSAGTELTGEVIVMARYDQDSDAISKQPGDVAGQIRVKIPADKIELTLDTILP